MDEASASRVRDRLGSTLRGKYLLESVLGVGGMGAVYSAVHRNTKRFAVKVLHTELSLNEGIRSRFLREGYAANKVSHPGTVAVLDDDVNDDGAAFLVMELLEGYPVDARADSFGGRLSVKTAVAIVDQLLDVLAAAHEKGIVHRDIKPANLFIKQDGTLKVLDFGIARARDAIGEGSGTGTATGTLLGTPAFMSPEQALAQSNEVDAQTDLWAAAATLFTLIAGQIVHEGDNRNLILVRAATREARRLASVAPGVPPAIAAVVDRGLAFTKEARWSSALEMREALRAAYEQAAGAIPDRIPLEDEPANLSEIAWLSGPSGESTFPLNGNAGSDSARADFSERGSVTPGPSVTSRAPQLTDKSAPERLGKAIKERWRPWWLAAAAAVIAALALALSMARSRGGASLLPTSPPSSAAQSPVQVEPSAVLPARVPVAALTQSAPVETRPAPTTPGPQAEKAKARITRPAVTTPGASPPVNCSPPYYVDTQGNRVFKRECI